MIINASAPCSNRAAQPGTAVISMAIWPIIGILTKYAGFPKAQSATALKRLPLRSRLDSIHQTTWVDWKWPILRFSFLERATHWYLAPGHKLRVRPGVMVYSQYTLKRLMASG